MRVINNNRGVGGGRGYENATELPIVVWHMINIFVAIKVALAVDVGMKISS